MARLYFDIRPTVANDDRREHGQMNRCLPLIPLDIDTVETSKAPQPQPKLTTPSWSHATAEKSSA
jgi:hypothetical protein